MLPVVFLVLGALISLGPLLWREKRQANRARDMLGVEVDDNLRILSAVRNAVTRGGESDRISTPETEDSARGRGLLTSPLPQWNRVVWESQTWLWPLVLDEQEIRELFKFHVQLETVTNIRSELADFVAERWADVRALEGRHPDANLEVFYKSEIDEKAGKAWVKFEEVARQILDSGNSLRKRRSWIQRLSGR